MLYPQPLIAAVQAASDIVDIVRERVPLKKKGTNYWGPCPFHNEKTPSFSVSPAKGIFKCFGCGRGGSVFQFIMEADGLSFGEAVKYLAERARIELPVPGREDDTRFRKEEALYETNRWAASQFTSNLDKPEAKHARSYLEKRGISPESISRFGLGYSMPGWDDLKSTAYRDQINASYLEELGLVIRGDQGNSYDRFRDRVMFPIQDVTGRYIGFGGRILTTSSDFAKYMNSPESAVYHKSKVLYGLYQARESIRREEKVIIVEGYLDVISLHQFGVTTAVATSGTALTPEQVQLIRRFTEKNVIFLYDGDSAGIKAMDRSLPVLFQAGISPQIVTLPNNHDPDSFIREAGKDQFDFLISNHSRSAVQFVTGISLNQTSNPTVKDRETAINRVIELAAQYPDPVGRDLMLKELAKEAGVPESTVFEVLNRRGSKPQPQPQPVRQPEPVSKPEKPAASTIQRVQLQAPERDLLKLIIDYGRDVAQYLAFFLAPGHFPSEVARTLFEKSLVLSQESEFWDLQALADRCNEAEQELVYRLAIEKYSISPRWKSMGFDPESIDVRKWIEDAIVRLRILWIDQQIRDYQSRLAVEVDRDIQKEILGYVKDLLSERKKLLAGDLFRTGD